MDNSILNEINNIKFLFNYNRTKTLNEQVETPVPTPTGSTQTPVPTPTVPPQKPLPTPVAQTPATPVPQGDNTSISNPEVSQASSITPDNPQASSSRIAMGAENDPYQYKFEDDGTTQKYYYAKKGQNDWKQSTNPKSVEAIKKNIFKIR